MTDFIRAQRPIPTDELPFDDRDCNICTTPYGKLTADNTIEYALKLDCGHHYGNICIKEWISRANTCPGCRAELFPQPHQSHDEDSDLVETTIGEVEARILDRFAQYREATVDEIDEVEALCVDPREHPEGRAPDGSDDEASEPWREISVRMRSAIHTRALYDEIRIREWRNGVPEQENLPELRTWERVSGTLGWERDRLLFEYLQRIGAFRVPGLDTMRRSLRWSTREVDEVIYNQLRWEGGRWDLDRRGWFCFGKRMRLDGTQPHMTIDEVTFMTLRDEGAFRTIGITRSFRDVVAIYGPNCGKQTPTDWEIFQQTKQDGAHWHSRTRCWYDEYQQRALYGDLPSSEDMRARRVWQDSRGFLSWPAGTREDVIDYIENLWLPGSRFEGRPRAIPRR